MILTLLLLLTFWCYSAISGYKDGILYSGKAYNALSWNIHHLFTAERVVVGCVFFVSYLCGFTLMFASTKHLLVWLFMTAFCIFMSFSFWHNGFYNLARKHIDSPHMKFMSNTGKYDVTMHFHPRERIAGLVLAMFFIIINTLFTVS